MKEKKSENFKAVFKELELESSKKILQITKDIKAIVSYVENQEEELEKISVVSIDTNQMYFSTST